MQADEQITGQSDFDSVSDLPSNTDKQIRTMQEEDTAQPRSLQLGMTLGLDSLESYQSDQAKEELQAVVASPVAAPEPARKPTTTTVLSPKTDTTTRSKYRNHRKVKPLKLTSPSGPFSYMKTYIMPQSLNAMTVAMRKSYEQERAYSPHLGL